VLILPTTNNYFVIFKACSRYHSQVDAISGISSQQCPIPSRHWCSQHYPRWAGQGPQNLRRDPERTFSWTGWFSSQSRQSIYFPGQVDLQVQQTVSIVLYSSICIAPQNSRKPTEALLVRLAPRKETGFKKR